MKKAKASIHERGGQNKGSKVIMEFKGRCFLPIQLKKSGLRYLNPPKSSLYEWVPKNKNS